MMRQREISHYSDGAQAVICKYKRMTLRPKHTVFVCMSTVSHSVTMIKLLVSPQPEQ